MAFLFEPIRILLAFVESLVVTVGFLVNAGGQFVPPGDYLAQLNGMKIFDNRAQDAAPQTAVHDIVLEFFEGNHGGKAPKCLLIGYDGARADALANTRDDPNAGTQLLKRGGGAIYNMYTGGNWYDFNLQSTVTACGWTTMLTGHWAVEKGGKGHGVTANGVTKPAGAPQLIFTELLEKGLAKKTSFNVSWGGHFTDQNASYLNDIDYCKANWPDAAAWVTMPDDAGTQAATLAALEEADCADMVMCILEHCDHAGHGNTFSNTEPAYAQAFQDAEKDAAALIAAVKARADYANEDWLILISSDHGGTFSGHGAQFTGERQIFLAADRKVLG
ncbi:MAG: alkaline phosphatase family protein [Oscillospiraceae bacterium]|jgi:hypothetical protein|nr:alkaline phosphatase family protein [Oscillospiraceae bacterium]